MKIKYVKHARNEYRCNKCFRVIEKGSSYLRGNIAFNDPIIRCTSCNLYPWEVTTSDYLLSVGPIVYQWEENYAFSESGVADMLIDLRDIYDKLEAKINNIPEQLRDSCDAGLLLEERKDSIDNAILHLENISKHDVKEKIRSSCYDNNSCNVDESSEKFMFLMASYFHDQMAMAVDCIQAE